MKYPFICKNCLTERIINIPITLRDSKIQCKKCGTTLTRIMVSPKMSTQTGCYNASKRDGVGCLITEDGKVHPPKTRGSSDTRAKARLGRHNNN